MPDRIKLLPEPVANQIAAGEVVNRPSSVVKELLENAVDAGANEITVNFRDGGKGLIQVVDNGCGMSEIDARLAFDRHATSKISDVEDIYRLHTFGFRGEALASIASVAEVELRTRMPERELGTKVSLAGGRFVSQEPVAAPQGSQFLIKNLFYNVPARRRFLEKSSTESRHIAAEFRRVALCHPDVAMNLFDSDTPVYRLPAGNLLQRITGIMGKTAPRNLLEVSTGTSIVTVSGFTGRPESARQTNKDQYLFVNGRYFKSAYFNKAVVSAYEKLIPANTQPSYFLYLEIEPERIDVNVHPQKTEVKFTDGSQVWQILNAAVRESLAKSGAVPMMDFDLDETVEIPVLREDTPIRIPGISANPDFNPFERYPDTPHTTSSKADVSDFMRGYDEADYRGGAVEGRGAGSGTTGAMGRISYPVYEKPAADDDYSRSVLEFIDGDDGVQQQLDMEDTSSPGNVMPLGERYFVIGKGPSLTVVDARRAREAVAYARYMSVLEEGAAASQQLLFPERIVLSSDDSILLKEYLGDFAALGFDIGFCDGNTVEIRGVPSDMASAPDETLLYDLLDSLREGETDLPAKRKERLAARLSRSGGGATGASAAEIEFLARELRRWGNPAFTPSGETVMKTLGEQDFKKLLQ